jgi:DNA-binding protein Fis
VQDIESKKRYYNLMRWEDAENQVVQNNVPTIDCRDALTPHDGFVPIEDGVCPGQSTDNDTVDSFDSRQQRNDQLSPMQCESMKVILLALLDRIDALESEVHENQVDTLDLRDEVNRFEGALIRAALASTSGRQRRAARVLGMKVSTLNAKLRRHGVIQITRSLTEATRDYPASGATG